MDDGTYIDIVAYPTHRDGFRIKVSQADEGVIALQSEVYDEKERKWIADGESYEFTTLIAKPLVESIMMVAKTDPLFEEKDD